MPLPPPRGAVPPLAFQYARSRIHSRPGTPPPGMGKDHHPISAPPTPVNTTHLLPIPLPNVPSGMAGLGALGMERCRSSEAVLTHSHSHVRTPDKGSGTISADATPRKPHPLGANPPPRTLPLHSSALCNSAVDDLAAPTLNNDDDDDENHLQPKLAHPDPPLLDKRETREHVQAQDHQNEHLDHEDHDERMDIDEVEVPVPELGTPTSDDHGVWGMPKWGLEDERPEVRPGVRLVGMEELPALIERHSMLDTPSQVVFPWLHGIADDGMKGREMGAFFGYAPPFEPPPYRGLTVVLAPPHPLDKQQQRLAASRGTVTVPLAQETGSARPPSPNHLNLAPQQETGSNSSGSYSSTGSTAITSPTTAGGSSLDPSTPPPVEKTSGANAAVQEASSDSDGDHDVQMHPTADKRVGMASPHSENTLPPEIVPDQDSDSASDSDESYISDDDAGPSCILLNAVHAQDVFELPQYPPPGRRPSFGRAALNAEGRPWGRFRAPRLPNQINLRNLNIQQIKYATISDIVLYTRNGVGPGILEVAEAMAVAQDELYRQRVDEFYRHTQGRKEGEGMDRPVKYGVWVLVEPFSKVEKFCPEFVNIDCMGSQTSNSRLVDLFEREAFESRAMTRASEVVEGFWVGNDTDVPGGADDGAGARVPFDMCVKASECSDMPTSAAIAVAYRQLLALDRVREQHDEVQSSWTASPATMALRNLLSPAGPATPQSMDNAPPPRPRVTELGISPDESHIYAQQHAAENHYVAIECAGSCRTITGQMRNLATMAEKVVELVSFLRKIIEGRDKTGIKRQVLVHCQDGYTESSILVLSYIMASLGVSLPEAYLHLQLVAKRSFFLYPTDKPLLHRIEMRLAQERRDRAIKCMRSTNGTASPATPSSPSSQAAITRWKPWGFIRGSGGVSAAHAPMIESPPAPQRNIDAARRVLVDEGQGGSQAALDCRVWFEDKRFDGFPSRILPFLYLGNLEHAGNAAMLKALGITHVVSVGESLLDVAIDYDPLHGYIGSNTLAAEARAGRIQVLDLTDVRDDGNDPLRPVIARACEWMEGARAAGGSVLVHCRVGVSRSASIVMAYLMKYRGMGLMDAYLMTRARRLNVLIQPNLRFFHELFGWEVELARAEADTREERKREAVAAGVRDPSALALLDREPPPRKILYTWPTFCRDVHCLNRRFLCN
ncbi:hypothetical protein CspeluHIS016_0111170 [Cutaneotrichosporon spelunceum]|uniref:Protein-tyrosine-phosphatase n=1 Tax=Cutaneotrichosporon spelunceum TaxID=1672016 RepID=A0AAD3Y944_9TREE|nr:hypothetical protein CspeluHIS016_0111170 [Cutaneotrichosporon spelunceum]